MYNQDYINLLKKVLIDYHHIGQYEFRSVKSNMVISFLENLLSALKGKEYALCYKTVIRHLDRVEGRDWPINADTMIGLKRLENIEFCFNEVIRNNIPGDFIETGVWKGGSTIFMQALLKSASIKNRKVWVADSFEGLPEPNEKLYSADKGLTFHKSDQLSISIEAVKQNFIKYDLLDENVMFLKGWFKDTLPAAPIKELALLRLDGDMYESTWDALVNLYPKLSKGGFILIDDYGSISQCRKAVDDFRAQNEIFEPILKADWAGIYWQKN